MNSTSRLSIMYYRPTYSSFQLSYNYFFDEFHHFEDDFFYKSDTCFVFESRKISINFILNYWNWIAFQNDHAKPLFYFDILFRNHIIYNCYTIFFFICVTRLVNCLGVQCVKRYFNWFDHPLFSSNAQVYKQLRNLHL